MTTILSIGRGGSSSCPAAFCQDNDSNRLIIMRYPLRWIINPFGFEFIFLRFVMVLSIPHPLKQILMGSLFTLEEIRCIGYLPFYSKNGLSAIFHTGFVLEIEKAWFVIRTSIIRPHGPLVINLPDFDTTRWDRNS